MIPIGNPRMKPETRLAFRGYEIVSRAVELGVAYGINRAYKHTDAPPREYIEEQVCNAIMSELCEVLDFDPDRDNSRT